MSQITVCALYKFVTLDNYQHLRAPLLKIMIEHQVRGTLLLAQEGINGTVAASRQTIGTLLDWLHEDPRLVDIDYKIYYTDKPPFKRSKVKLKKEIVTLGIEGINPNQVVGTYVNPSDWNQLISDPEVLLLDTRNDYEVQVGTFKRAINPKTSTFREFPAYVRKNLDRTKHKKVAMFCTGGIRCEKSTTFLKNQGFDQVFQLKGGILNYLQKVPQQETLWNGECFVFDDRVTVNHQLEPGSYDQCHACRRPITPADKANKHYQQGVSCPYCYDQCTEAQKTRFREREKQIRLSEQRGEMHLGEEAAERIRTQRELRLSGV